MKEEISAPVLFTERLILRDMTEKDAPFVVEWRGNPDIYHYFISPHRITLEEHLHWFKNKYLYDGNRFDWIATLKDGEPIGVFGLKRECMDSKAAEISYILSPKYYGNGYASEAVKKLMEFSKESWKCNKIIAEIHRDNTISIRFIERLLFSPQKYIGAYILYEKNI